MIKVSVKVVSGHCTHLIQFQLITNSQQQVFLFPKIYSITLSYIIKCLSTDNNKVYIGQPQTLQVIAILIRNNHHLLSLHRSQLVAKILQSSLVKIEKYSFNFRSPPWGSSLTVCARLTIRCPPISMSEKIYAKVSAKLPS